MNPTKREPTKKETTWINPRGLEVPIEYIPRLDKERHKAVNRIYTIGKKLQKQMLKAKTDIVRLMENFEELSLADSGITPGGEKGNMTLTNFSGTRKVERTNQEYVDVNEKLEHAIKQINQCVTEWCHSIPGNTPIVPLVQSLLKPDRKGHLSFKGLRTLKSLNVHHEGWKKAMSLLEEAFKIVSSKYYFRIYERPSSDKSFELVSLDFSSLENDTPEAPHD